MKVKIVEQDVVWILVAFGVLATAIIGLKVFVHTKAKKMEEERNASKSKADHQ